MVSVIFALVKRRLHLLITTSQATVDVFSPLLDVTCSPDFDNQRAVVCRSTDPETAYSFVPLTSIVAALSYLFCIAVTLVLNTIRNGPVTSFSNLISPFERTS